MRVAVIPARGGSQRIPRKNIRDFRGRPMMAWTIEAARKSGLFETILVSTDSETIAEVARREGAVVPFLRSPDLADHQTPLLPVIRDAIVRSAPQASTICALLPTAPTLLPADLIAASQKLEADPALGFVISGTRFSFPIQRALRLDAQDRVSMFHPEHQLTRSQDLEPAYHDAGQFYFGRREAWQECEGIFDHHTALLPLPAFRVQDIDEQEDWQRAELLHELLEKQDLL